MIIFLIKKWLFLASRDIPHTQVETLISASNSSAGSIGRWCGECFRPNTSVCWDCPVVFFRDGHCLGNFWNHQDFLLRIVPIASSIENPTKLHRSWNAADCVVAACSCVALSLGLRLLQQNCFITAGSVPGVHDELEGSNGLPNLFTNLSKLKRNSSRF